MTSIFSPKLEITVTTFTNTIKLRTEKNNWSYEFTVINKKLQMWMCTFVYINIDLYVNNIVWVCVYRSSVLCFVLERVNNGSFVS